FFSSRRRHTRLQGDWSSDVCSSDLAIPIVFDLPAFAIVMLITWVLVRGIRESAWVNSAMVALKLVIIGFFVLVGSMYVKPANWRSEERRVGKECILGGWAEYDKGVD